LFKAGLHVKFTGDSAILAPQFIVGKSHIDDMCGMLRDVLGQY